MTQLALLLTIVFILYALRRDIRDNPHVSPASWISFIWIALSASRSINYWVYPSQAIAFNQRIAWEQQSIDLIQNNPLERNLMIVLILLGLMALSRRKGRFMIRFEENSWVALFYAFTLVSIAWSDYQGVALKRWIRFIGDVVAILLILTDIDPEQTVDRVLRRMAILLLPLSVLFIRYYGQLGRIYTTYGTQMWVGVTGHKNQLGMLCAFSAVFLVWRGLKKWPRIDILDGFLLALAIYLLVGSKSQTSMIVFLLGSLILVVQSRIKGDVGKFNRIVVGALIGLFAVQALAIMFLDKSLAPAFFSAAGRDASFTGRVPLWQELLKMSGRSPFFGSGFSSFWLDSGRVMEVWQRVGWTPTTAHNGYLDILLDLGIAGLGLLVLLIVQSHRNIMRGSAQQREWGQLKMVFFIMVLFHNFTETSLGKPNSLLWLLFLLASFIVWPAGSRASMTNAEGATETGPSLPSHPPHL